MRIKFLLASDKAFNRHTHNFIKSWNSCLISHLSIYRGGKRTFKETKKRVQEVFDPIARCRFSFITMEMFTEVISWLWKASVSWWKLMLVEINGVGQLCTKGECKSYGVLLIAGSDIYSNGRYDKNSYCRVLFVLIPILQKAKEGSGWWQRMS